MQAEQKQWIIATIIVVVILAIWYWRQEAGDMLCALPLVGGAFCMSDQQNYTDGCGCCQ